MLVSGSASQRTSVGGPLDFGSPRPGYMALDFHADGSALLRVFEDRGLPQAVEVYRSPIHELGRAPSWPSAIGCVSPL